MTTPEGDVYDGRTNEYIGDATPDQIEERSDDPHDNYPGPWNEDILRGLDR